MQLKFGIFLIALLWAASADAQQTPVTSTMPAPPQTAPSVIAVEREWQAVNTSLGHFVKAIHDLAVERDKLAADLNSANAEITTLKVENENLKAPPKAADKSKP